MNFYKKFVRKKKILLFIFAFIFIEVIFFTAIMKEKLKFCSYLSNNIEHTHSEIKMLEKKYKKLIKIEKQNKNYYNKKCSAIDFVDEKNICETLINGYDIKYSKDSGNLSFKINSKNFQDLIKFSEKFRFSYLSLKKLDKEKYIANINFKNNKIIQQINKIDISEKINQDKLNKFKEQNKVISEKKDKVFQLSKTDFKEKPPIEELNKRIEEDVNNINIAYSKKITISEDEIELLISETGQESMIYDMYANIFDIYLSGAEKENINLIMLKDTFDAKAVSFEVFYNDLNIENIGLYNEDFLENIEEKRISDWNKLIFYDIKDFKGIYFRLRESGDVKFSLRNIEVYI